MTWDALLLQQNGGTYSMNWTPSRTVEVLLTKDAESNLALLTELGIELAFVTNSPILTKFPSITCIFDRNYSE